MKDSVKQNRLKAVLQTLLLLKIFIIIILFSPNIRAAEEAYPVIFEATQKAVISAEFAGVLNSLNVDVGSIVKKGGVIAKVDVGDLDLKKKRSEFALRHLNVKVANLERLNQRGLATNEELEQTRMEMDVTITDIDILKRQIGNSAVYAPFECVVVRRRVQPHEWVTLGQPIVDVVDPSTLQAVANIPSRLAVKLEKGASYTFFVHDLNLSVNGTVHSVVPEVDELSNTAQVIWKIGKPPKDLLSGMKGEVRIDNSDPPAPKQ